MKFTYSEKMSRAAARTVETFSSALIEMLSRQRLEDVRASELCKRAGYPRSTFYNYFEDVYDLMRFCWHLMAGRVFAGGLYGDREDAVYLLFEKLYDFLDENRGTVSAVLRHNGGGFLLASLRQYSRETADKVFAECPLQSALTVPAAFLAEHYSGTVMLVLEWCFVRQPPLSKAQALEYMRRILPSCI